MSIGLTDGLIHQQYNSEDEVYHTILHEIGHGLGLGHSYYDTDIMYTPHKYGVVSLSGNDIKSIQWLYKLPAGKNVTEIGRQHSVITESDIDLVISKIESPSQESQEIEQTSTQEARNLLHETDNIANVKKYNMLLQNVGISEEMRKFFIDKHRNS